MFKRIYLSPNGRCSRGFYWQCFVVPFAVAGFLVGLLEVFFRTTFLLVLVLLALWPSVVIQIKRWHDIGASGWWTLLSFIPYAGLRVWIVMGLIPGTPGSNRYGRNPTAPTEVANNAL